MFGKFCLEYTIKLSLARINHLKACEATKFVISLATRGFRNYRIYKKLKMLVIPPGTPGDILTS
jgi:hypothetical protein